MTSYFITSTGTGIGKTLITCALAHHLRAQGKRVRALKPVISGFAQEDAAASDTGRLLQAQGLPVSAQTIDALSPWRFAAPLSPDMAAQDEGRAIDFDQLTAFCRKRDPAETLLIEGAGGIMTPLNAQHTMLDLAEALGHPVILVAGSYLGTLSHTLTAALAIAAADLTLRAVVVSESEDSPVASSRTIATLERFLPSTRFHLISRLDSRDELWKYVPASITGIL